MLILEADYLVTDSASPVIAGGAVAISGDRILAAGTARHIRAAYPSAEPVSLGHVCLMPGFVNAHQHGRGLSQIQLGFPDDNLEPWIARRRGRGAPDPYALTRLAALEMLANGVTATLHANYSYGSGDYETELRASIRAYEETGLRATICVGYADRGALVYPPADERAFQGTLSPAVRALIQNAQAAYLPLDATLDLMARLSAEYDGHPTIRFAYGPAGPQWVSDEAWRVLAADAKARGLGLHFHLLESPAQAKCARLLYPEGVLSSLESLGVFEAPASAAHFVHATPQDIADAVRLGLAIVANPGSNMRLGNGQPPVAALTDAGAALALGTDNCALDDNEDYLAELRLGRLLARSTSSSNATQMRTWFAAGTETGARAVFLPDTGRIEPGAKADLIAMDMSRISGAYLDADIDILDVVMARGTGRDIVMTMVDGSILCRDGVFLHADIDEARRAAEETARASRLDSSRWQAADELASALRRHYGYAAS